MPPVLVALASPAAPPAAPAPLPLTHAFLTALAPAA